MSEPSTPQFTETFRQEANELLDVIEEAILNIEENPEDKESLHRLFRSVHTIKGSSAMLGYDDIVEFSHHLENLLDKVRDGIVPITGELIDLILVSRDQIKIMLDAIEDNAEIDLENIGRIIVALENLLPDAERKIPRKDMPDSEENKRPPSPFAPKENDTVWRIRFSPHRDIFASGTEPALLLNELRDIGECVIAAQTHEIPELKQLNPERCYLSWDIVLITNKGINRIKEVFIFVKEDSYIKIEAIEESISKDNGIPRLGEILLDRADVTPELIQKALSDQKRLGELLVESGKVSPDRIASALNEQTALKQHKSRASEASIRVPSDKLDELINLVGELVINQAHLNQVVSDSNETGLVNPIKESERLIGKLRDCTLNIRMLPIGILFGKFRRLVRDLGVELGKEVELITKGADTELDKSVIERLNDPLLHLIRNAIDHGIEMPEHREKIGKPRKGSITLTAAHKGTHVVITLQCDGRGIDIEVVRKRAIERGVISEKTKLSDNGILYLIFAPGFSTAKTITNLSGRGVGLDVVKREIEALGGTVQLSTIKGKGTRFELSLPLTLAIIDCLLVQIKGIHYVLPIAPVIKCMELTSQQNKKAYSRNIVSIDGELIPFIRLRDIFDISGDKIDIEHIVMVQVENQRVGIVVDEIIGTYQTLIKSLGRTYKDTEGVSGATIMGDGTVVLILDIPGIVRCAKADEL